MKQKLKIYITWIILLLLFIVTATYALIPSEIEALNKELNQNRWQRIANNKMIETLTAENKSLRSRADEIKVEMFWEEVK